METSVWNRESFEYPSGVPTMLSDEETLYLYWLGRKQWDGSGLIVEIGPWLGGSTVCLAAGMRDFLLESGRKGGKQLKVFDNFIWREFMSVRADLKLKPGESFQSAFLKNLSGFESIVDAYARALPDETIEGDREAQGKRFHETGDILVFQNMFEDPVSILFIDGAKSWQGMLHLFRELYTCFVPGKTLLVCQDYKYWGTYWVTAMMSGLMENLEPVHNVLPGTTVTFRLTGEITGEHLNGYPDSVSDLNTEETLGLIERAARLLADDGDGAGFGGAMLGKVSFLCHQGSVERAAKEFKDIQSKWKKSWPDWQLERARCYLRDERNMNIDPPFSVTFAKTVRQIAGKTKRILKGK